MQWFSYEAFGYFASALIVISLAMRSLIRLRIVNLVGASSMAVYGVLIEAYPVAVLNALIVCIDVYYLVEFFTRKDLFTVLEVRPESHYLRYFLDFYADEIKRFLPGFSYDASKPGKVCFILRNLVPAGLFITEPRPEKGLFVALDFVIPGYRDLKIGKYVYNPQSQLLAGNGIDRLFSEPGTPKHESYLRRMGFRPEDPAATCYTLLLK